MPPPPEAPEGSEFLFAGDRYLVYGGCARDHDGNLERCGRARGGAELDPATGRWSRIPPSPAGVSGPAAWTGEEAMFLGSVGGETAGFAYDPAERTWRPLSPAPVDRAEAAIWTGSELLVWGGTTRFGSGLEEGAAYDPATDAWREIADPPIGLNLFDLVWTGSEAIAFGSLLDGGNSADTRVSVGAAYDPEEDAWRRIADSDLSPQATAAVWLDGRMVAYDYGGQFQLYDPAADEWTRSERMPIDAGECYPDAVAADGYVVAFYCGQIALFDPARGTWRRIDGGLTERLHDRIPVWRFSQIASDGEEVLFLAEGLTFGTRGEAQYNFPGAPMSLWAYRPSAPSYETASELRECGPETAAGGWGGSVAGIPCNRAGKLILHRFIGDFENAVTDPYRYYETAIAEAGPGRFESAGFECSYGEHEDKTGWPIRCVRGTEKVAFNLTR